MSELSQSPIGVVGARSMVGRSVLKRLQAGGRPVLACSRSTEGHLSQPGVQWHRLNQAVAVDCRISHWIVVAPIWVLPDCFAWLRELGARRVVALSSTSCLSKQHSSLIKERALATRLKDGERQLMTWAEANGIEWTVLRPTLIYGHGEDQNVTQIARLVRRLGFFPLLGGAQGLRQPVHVEDVAEACCRALVEPRAVNQTYTLSGGEILSYREMVARIARAAGVTPRFISLPSSFLRAGLPILRRIPRYRDVNSAMIQRMNQDLVYDHEAAQRDFAFAPRHFQPTASDVQPGSRA